jgi:glycosyltransferase involved in cell wall biosynthesis
MSQLRPAAIKVATPKAVVLVGIVTRNRAAILPKTIQSALSQSYPHVRIAVLDDGSDDGTSALQSDFPAVQWSRWESSRGYVEARNQLMRTARADYYVSLDDDAWFMNGDEIAMAIDRLEATPTVAAIAFDILSPDRPHRAFRTEPHPIAMFIGCGHVLRLSALRDSGFYTPSPGLYGSEEKDLCLRLLDRHWDIHFLPGVHVWHDKSGIARNQLAQHRSGVCNDLTFTLRRCPLPLILIVLPAKILSHLRFSVRHRSLRPCLAGVRLFFRHVLAIWKSRNPVHSGTFGEFLRRSRQAS